MRLRAPASKTSLNLRLPLLDFIWLALAPFIALLLRSETYLDWPDFPHNIPTTYQYALATTVASLVIFISLRVGDSLPHLFSSRDISRLITACALCVLSGVFVAFTLSHAEGVARSVPLIYGLVLMFGLVAHRLVARGLYREKRVTKEQSGEIGLRRVVIVGLNPFSISAIKLTDAQNPRTVQVIAALSHAGKYAGRTLDGVKILGSTQDLTKIIDEYHIHGVDINELWIADELPESAPELYEKICAQAAERSLKYDLISTALGLSISKSREEQKLQNESLRQDLNQDYFPLKRALDLLVATLLLFLLLPIYAIIIPLLIFDVGFPIVFWQERVGRKDKSFQIYKFRTLKHPLTKQGAVLKDEERLSNLGRFLRKYRLDEYPQLINILKGDMSGIGPRPFLKKEQPKDSYYRSQVRPGISGWAQINGGDELTFEEKNLLDTYYVLNATLAFDIEIVFKSILVLLKGVKRNEQAVREAQAWVRAYLHEFEASHIDSKKH